MTPHPLDPLSAAEISAASAIIRAHGGLDETAWFETISPTEVDKAALAAFSSGTGPRPARRAFVACYEPSSNRTFDGFVNLDAGTLESFNHVPGMQARIGADEFDLGSKIAIEDPGVRAALAKRGITDFSKVLIEPWAAGDFGFKEEKGERLAYGHCWLANDAGDNPYGRPIANVHPLIDLRRRRVIRVDDFGIVPLPPDPGPIVRPDEPKRVPKPLDIVQPDGPSFAVNGHHVRWQGWNLRVGFNVREGLVLHEIGYEDRGNLRPIMHRASLAEMVVPYGEPNGGNFRRNAFDVGEYGVGQLLDSLELGCDCLGHIHYFDAHAHDWQGEPWPIKNAICMHEEDFGLLWKFSDYGKKPLLARSRRLVISSISTIGNYVYGFFWYFYQDGTIGIEVKATGIPFPTNAPVGATSPYAQPMAPGILGHTHQHVFCYRFDMAVDGLKNAVREVNFRGAPIGPANPAGNAMIAEITSLKTEQAAQRTLDMASQRFWIITNPEKRNGHGQEPGYKLVMGQNALPFHQQQAPVLKRARFMEKHFWATRYSADELYPAGWYPNQHAGEDGLPRWTKADRQLEAENVVVWTTLNYHHMSRPEDWPVQPVVYAGFHWMPFGFFDRSPALDVAAPAPSCCT